MIRLLSTIICAASLGPLVGQWSVPVAIELDGDAPADRQVTGAASPTGADHGASMVTDRNNTTAFATATGGNTLQVSLVPALEAYRPGARLTLLPATTNTGAVTLNVDGLGPIAVLKDVSAELDSADLPAGVPFQVVFDGAAFQVTNQLHPSCPSGFKPIGRDACVEMSLRGSATWYGAVNQCTARGHRLCSFAEWIRACQMPGGILPTITEYEWVDEAANHNNYAKLMGTTPEGVADCLAGGLRVPNGTAPYRCCSSR